jgi:hypothetical protein
MRSDEIRDVFRDCIKSMLEIIKKHGKIQTYYDYTPKINLHDRTWHLEIERINVYPRLFEFEDELMKLAGVKNCLAIMLEENFPKRLEIKIVDKNGKPVQNPNYEPFLMAEVLGVMIYKYLERYGYDFHEEKFEEIYREMIDYVYSSGMELIVISPLENFDLRDLDEFSVDEYKIRRLTEREIKALIGFGYHLGFTFSPDHGIIENIYCLERIIKASKKHIPPLRPHIEDFITALRLFKPGVIGFNFILCYPKTAWGFSWSGEAAQHTYSYKRPPKYIFEQRDLKPFISLWNQFKKVKNQFPNNIKFSLRWFNKSYTEQEVLDRLLDLAIALEVLFKDHNRLDLYLAHFIGSSKDEKVKINKDIKELREIRNKIVHSGHRECKWEFVDLIENYYRLSMQKFLKLLLSQNYESIIESIKESMLN